MTTPESNEGGGETSEVVARVKQGIISILNLDLLPETAEDLAAVNWYRVSVRVYYVGALILMGWSVVMLLSFFINYAVNSRGPFGLVGRLLTVSPFVPVGLWMFAGAARHTVGRMRDMTYPEDEHKAPRNDLVKVASVSGVALILAVSLRYAVYITSVSSLGQSLSGVEAVSMMFIDVSWVSLLLIALGGIGRIITVDDIE